MKNTLLLRGGYVVDPDTKFEGRADILIEDGVISRVSGYPGGENLYEQGALSFGNIRVIDADGLTVFPGLVDLHVHLRDPGALYKEDIRTGAAAALHGGVTSFLAMPNTNPPMDRVERISYVMDKARECTKAHVYQTASATLEMAGKGLVDIDALVDFGVKAFSEDGKSVMNTALMYDAMKKFAARDVLFCDHCEDIALVRGGVMNDDARAKELTLPGIPNATEDVITARDAVLAAETGARLHLCHASTEGAMRILSAARENGARVTAEVCPHHFTLSSADIPGDDANYKMNPPLRTRRDVEALREALHNDLVDCISTDHAPHSAEEKSRGFLKAPFGIVGLETSAALAYTELVKTGVLTLMQMAEKMSANPAKILRIPAGSLRPGSRADIAVFDFAHPYVIDPGTFASKGRNTPFKGREVYGKTRYTIVGGEVVYEG